MAIDPNEIELNPEQKRLIAERAARNGKPWQTVLQDAIAEKGGESVPTRKEDDDLDVEFLALIAEDLKELNEELGDTPVSHERMREILSKIPGSIADDIIEDRGDR